MYRIKDTSKGQKIVAAIYLVTQHLSDNDPIKNSLRDNAVSLILSADLAQMSTSSSRIASLLETSIMSGLVSEKNAHIIISEINNFVAKENSHTSADMKSFFGDSNQVVGDPIKKTLPEQTLSFKPHAMSVSVKKSQSNFENKNKRQKDILDFINKKKSVGIKDIASLLSDISEKTIQRELNILVQKGQITKRGTKRWSTYMAVTK
jgi:hypothetical protein